MIKMELNQSESDACRRWSPTVSPRGTLSRSHRNKSRTYDLKHGPEVWDTKSRRVMDGSASLRKDFEKHRRGGEGTCLPVKDELEEGEVPRESKRGRYSDHHIKENFTDSLERRHYSHERLPQRHGTDSNGEEKHELFKNSRSSRRHDFSNGRCQRHSAFKNANHAASFDGGRLMKDKSRKRIYHRRDSDASFGQSEPHFGEDHRQLVEGYSSSPQGMADDQPDLHKHDHKRGYNVECDNHLSRNGPQSGDRTTINESSKEKTSKDAPNSTKSNNVRLAHYTETNNSLSWNGPKWGEETTTEDIPTFSKWRSDNVSHAADISLPWNGSKSGEETNSKGAPDFSQWKSVSDGPCSNVKIENSLSCDGPKWGDNTNTNDALSSWNSSTTKRDSKETNNSSSWNGPRWDDWATTKGAPNSSQWRSDVDKWGSNINTNNCSSWPKWGDETTTKDAPNSSRWRTNADGQGSHMKTDDGSSCNGETTENAPISTPWPINDDRHGSNVETDNGLTWKGPKWGDRTTTKSMPDSSRHRLDNDKQANSVETRKTSWYGPKQDVRRTSKDAPKSSKWRYDGDKRDYSVRIGNSKDAPISSQWKSVADDPGSSVEIYNSLSCTGPKRGDETNAKDAPSSWRSSTTKWDSKETNNSSSWKCPNRDVRAMTKDASSSSQWRSDADKWGSNVKTDSSSSWPKWGDETNAKDARSSWRSSTTKWDSKETNNSSSWDAPKWDDRVTAKVAPSSSPWRSDVDKWSNVKTDNSSSWPKWGVETPTEDAPNSSRWRKNEDRQVSKVKTDNSSSWNGPKWGNETTEDAPNSSGWRVNADIQGSNVETDNSLTWKGPKWGDQTATKNMPDSARHRLDNDKQGNNVESQKASWNCPMWGDHRTTKDAQKSQPVPKWDDHSDKQGYDLEIDNKISQSVQKGFEFTVNDAPNSSHQRSENAGPRASAYLSMRTEDTTHEAYPLSYPSLKNPEQNTPHESYQRAIPTHDNISQETSRKDQHILNISQFPCNLNLTEHDGGDKHKLNIGEQNQLPPPYETQNQQMAHSISTNCQHAMPQLPSKGQGLKSNWHSPQVGSGMHLSQQPVTLKPFTDEASAFTARVPMRSCLGSLSTEPLTSGPSHLNHPIIVKESQTSPGGLAQSSSSSPSSTDGDVSCSNFEGKLQHGKQGSKQVEIIGDEVMKMAEKQTRQSKKEENTSHPNVADSDVRKVGEINKVDEKGIRMFKFAIVEFVKDMLKPAWKEGHLSIEAHKTIAKKVVDKVIGTLQGTNIPQTQRNIDLYISYSKTKLTNLVQAYLEMYAKI